MWEEIMFGNMRNHTHEANKLLLSQHFTNGDYRKCFNKYVITFELEFKSIFTFWYFSYLNSSLFMYILILNFSSDSLSL